MSAPDQSAPPAATDGARPTGPTTVVSYDPPPPDTDDDDTPDAGSTGTPDLAAEVEKWKALAQKHEARSKANKAAADRLAQLEAEKGTDLERAVAQARAEAAKETSTKFTQRLATVSITAAAAAAGFQDPDVAVALLANKIGEFIDDDGDVDEKAIQREVTGLLKTRSYLGKQKPPPDMDGGQRQGSTGQIDMNRFIRSGIQQ